MIRVFFFYLLILSMIACSDNNSDFNAIRFFGRMEKIDKNTVRFGYSGAKIETRFTGTSIKALLSSPEKENYLFVIIDNGLPYKLYLNNSETQYITLAENLPDTIHSIELIKITESLQGYIDFGGFLTEKGKHLLPPTTNYNMEIHFIGNSITCGYGIESFDENETFEPHTENFYDTYAGITARYLGASYQVVARSGIGMYRNYGSPNTGSDDCMFAIYDRIFYDKPEPVYNFKKY
ncbi:MAG: lipase, partial [Bacteroidales bacterium]